MDGGRPRTAVVIEDDADTRALLQAILAEAGFTSQATGSGLEGVDLVRTGQPTLTTLDVVLPGIDGFEVARRLRSLSNTYIMMVTGRAEEIDVLMGLDAGADDYLTKPFRPRELRARIEAMLRRDQLRSQSLRAGAADESSTRSAPGADPATSGTGGPDLDQPQTDHPDQRQVAKEMLWLSHNGLRVNLAMRLCELEGQVVDLTRSEFALLVAIMLGERRVISKGSLALDLRGDADGYVSDADQRVVESHIAHLRRKLNDPVGSPRFIETVRGVGYRLTAARPGQG